MIKIHRTLLMLVAALCFAPTQLLAAAPTPALAQPCSACHGEQGVSISSEFPNLAGQKAQYLITQIKAFRDQQRSNAVMTPFVQGLTDTQIGELAQYYASLEPAHNTANEVNEAGQNVRARCISCHGMQGKTVNSEWPNLAGQKSAYLQKQLLDFQSGARPSPVMEVIARELTAQQIADVAEYYSQL